jgi:hypothetical protein
MQIESCKLNKKRIIRRRKKRRKKEDENHYTNKRSLKYFVMYGFVYVWVL